jgi:hypothetical protein
MRWQTFSYIFHLLRWSAAFTVGLFDALQFYYTLECKIEQIKYSVSYHLLYAQLPTVVFLLFIKTYFFLKDNIEIGIYYLLLDEKNTIIVLYLLRKKCSNLWSGIDKHTDEPSSLFGVQECPNLHIFSIVCDSISLHVMVHHSDFPASSIDCTEV